ncbi:hypothetical protein [Sphingomonas sp. SAFR-052]|uniref:hypothetical protein n=1 Tax=Sphingomonas sp. SAFR-052 TaxID=3436867 RepID=UPI003F7D6890
MAYDRLHRRDCQIRFDLRCCRCRTLLFVNARFRIFEQRLDLSGHALQLPVSRPRNGRLVNACGLGDKDAVEAGTELALRSAAHVQKERGRLVKLLCFDGVLCLFSKRLDRVVSSSR